MSVVIPITVSGLIGLMPAPFAREESIGLPTLPKRLEGPAPDRAHATDLLDAFPGLEIADHDNNGRVSDADLIAWIEHNLAPDLIVADLNADGYLTATEEVAALVGELARRAPSDVSTRARTNAAARALAAIDGTLTQARYTGGHLGAISRGWGPSRHNAHTSGFRSKRDRDRYPENHAAPISLRWSGTHSVTVSRAWPAQHDDMISRSWGHVGGDPGDHALTTSIGWPARHTRGVSMAYVTPEDAPYPLHSSFTSSRWPPNHTFRLSGTFQSAEHDPSTSATWQHLDPSAAAEWPPNHTGAISATWSTEKHVARWPTEHHGQVSTFWHPDARRGEDPWWPANHASTTSRNDQIPALDAGGGCD
jgi:hypothetical protein